MLLHVNFEIAVRVFSAVDAQLNKSSIVERKVAIFSPSYFMVVTTEQPKALVSMKSPTGASKLSGDIAFEIVFASFSLLYVSTISASSTFNPRYVFSNKRVDGF